MALAPLRAFAQVSFLNLGMIFSAYRSMNLF
jgi:hypothetical protein